MKIIFFGSDDFAARNLEKLISSSQKVVGCVTQPDRPKGRGLKITPSPIKVLAQRNNIPVLQPEKIKDDSFVNQLKEFNSDLFVVIAYGKILPQEILSVPRLGAINAHASLLPKYRGAAPIDWVIINGEKETGISIIKLNAALDAGDILCQEKMDISDDDTAVSLRSRLADLSADCLLSTVASLEKGKCLAVAQDEKLVTYAPKLSKETGLIDWNKTAEEIHNLARGLLPWPTAYTHFHGKTLKILETKVVPLREQARPGEVVKISAEGFVVATGEAGLLIKKVHPESGREMAAKSFVAGHALSAGTRLE